jgi:hypothetical protein
MRERRLRRTSDLRPTLEGEYATSEPRTDARGYGTLGFGQEMAKTALACVAGAKSSCPGSSRDVELPGHEDFAPATPNVS